jgi:PleD family two-component response regulator
VTTKPASESTPSCLRSCQKRSLPFYSSRKAFRFPFYGELCIATLTDTLRASPSSPWCSPASWLSPKAGGMPKCILIVDDHEHTRKLIRSFLEHLDGFVCGEAVDGLDAIQKAASLNPDLIVLDFQMPRMNGLEGARVLNQRTRCRQPFR